jgi:peptidoglycan/xylan/chitin deacetylase (PgdA/CDA1 family)
VSGNAAQVTISSFTSGDAKWVMPDITVTPGTTYTLTHQYQATAPTSLVVRYTSPTGAQSYVFLKNLPAASTWATTTTTFTAPAGVRSASVWHVLAQVGSLTTDSYRLTGPAGTTTPPTDTTPPTVTITAPVTGTTASGTVTLAATATDVSGIGGVTFYAAGVPVGSEDTTAPYSVSLDSRTYSNGPLTLLAVARDSAGNRATSSPVTVTVNNLVTPPPPPPSGTNLIPNGDLETAGAGVPAGWVANSWGMNSTAFTYPMTGRNGSRGASLSITNYRDGDAKWQPPEIPMTIGALYTFGSWYRSNTISDVIGRYTMADGRYVYFGVVKEIPPSPSWAFATATFTPPQGAVTVTFFHLISFNGFLDIDDMSLVVSGTATSTNDITPPTVSWLAPLADQTVSGSVLLSASATDAVALRHVWFAVGGNQVSPFLTSGPYEFLWDSRTVPNGTYVFKATALDLAGNNSLDQISVTVLNSDVTPPRDTIPPTVALTSPARSSTVSGAVTLTATATDAGGVAHVRFLVDGIPVGAEDTTAPYTYTWDSVTQPNGNVTITAVATDRAGNTATSSGVVVTVRNSVPTDVFAKGMVTVTFDDGWISDYQTVLPLLDQFGVTGSFGIISENLPGGSAAYTNLSEVQALAAAGHEINSHTRSHPFLTILNPTELAAEVAGSRTDLLGFGLPGIFALIYPYGEYSSAVVEATRAAGYGAARSVETGYNRPDTDRYALKSQNAVQSTSVAEVQSWIDTAIANRTWLIITYHRIDRNGGEYANTPEHLEGVLEYLTSTGVDIVTLEEGVAQLQSL